MLIVTTLGVVGVERSTSETARWTSKGRKIGARCICNARRASPQGRANIWVVFSCKGAERDKWRFCGVWSKSPNSSARRPAIGCFQGNQYIILLSTVLFVAIALQQTILPPSSTLILCEIARKSLKIADFSKTGSRNMAETCAINFLNLVSYSTCIVTGGLRRLLLPVLMWAGVDFENFAQNRQSAVFAIFPMFDHPLQKY